MLPSGRSDSTHTRTGLCPVLAVLGPSQTHRSRGRLRLCLAGSPVARAVSSSLSFRTNLPLPAAPHPALPRRSCLPLPRALCLPEGNDFHILSSWFHGRTRRGRRPREEGRRVKKSHRGGDGSASVEGAAPSAPRGRMPPSPGDSIVLEALEQHGPGWDCDAQPASTERRPPLDPNLNQQGTSASRNELKRTLQLHPPVLAWSGGVRTELSGETLTYQLEPSP
jgi:hypothetical protein